MRPPSPLNPPPSLSSLSRRLRNVYPRPFATQRFEAFPGSTGSANAGVKPGASPAGERDAEKASGQKDHDEQGASHEADAHDSHAEGESSAKKKTTTAAIAKPAIFDEEARSTGRSVTSGLGPKTSTKSAARIVSKPAQQAAPAASEEGTETAGTVEENEFIPMRPFTPSGSSYQEKPQQSYGYATELMTVSRGSRLRLALCSAVKVAG